MPPGNGGEPFGHYRRIALRSRLLMRNDVRPAPADTETRADTTKGLQAMGKNAAV